MVKKILDSQQETQKHMIDLFLKLVNGPTIAENVRERLAQEIAEKLGPGNVLLAGFTDTLFKRSSESFPPIESVGDITDEDDDEEG